MKFPCLYLPDQPNYSLETPYRRNDPHRPIHPQTIHHDLPLYTGDGHGNCGDGRCRGEDR